MLPDPGTNAGADPDAWIAMRMPGRDVEVELGDLFSDDHEVTVPRRLRHHARAVGHSAAFGRNKYKHTLHDIRVAEIFSPPRVVPPLESRGKAKASTHPRTHIYILRGVILTHTHAHIP